MNTQTKRHWLCLRAGLAITMVVFSAGCLSQYNATIDPKSTIAFESGRRRNFHFVFVTHFARQNRVLLEQCDAVAGNHAGTAKSDPCIPASGKFTQSDLRSLIDWQQGYRLDSFLIHEAKQLNPEIGKRSKVYIIGTSPLMLAFPEQQDIIAQKQEWQSTVGYAQWPAESKRLWFRDEIPLTRRPSFVGPEEFGTRVGSIAIFPEWAPASTAQLIGECDLTPGDVRLFRLPEAITLQKLLSSELDALLEGPGVVSMATPVRDERVTGADMPVPSTTQASREVSAVK